MKVNPFIGLCVGSWVAAIACYPTADHTTGYYIGMGSWLSFTTIGLIVSILIGKPKL